MFYRSTHSATARGFAALMAGIALLQFRPASSAPADIFVSPAPTIGADPPKASDIRVGSASVATQTGALQFSVPIQVPPGRNGAAPKLSLDYSSQASTYGGIAAGWSLGIPEIREDTSGGRMRTGAPQVETDQAAAGIDPRLDDRFVSSIAGGRKLVLTHQQPAPGVFAEYRAQNDASFARYERMEPGAPYRWRVSTTDGTVMYFGESAHMRWCGNVSDGYAPLTSTTDGLGNQVTYQWESQVQDECRIGQIRWGQNPAAGITEHFAQVDFAWHSTMSCLEAGYVGGHLDYRTGKKILSGASRLLSIRATAFELGGQTQPEHTRLYTLQYDAQSEQCTNQHAPVRLLTSIQESAWGNDAQRVDLPPITFEYGSPTVKLVERLSQDLAWMDGGGLVSAKPRNLGWGRRRTDDRWPTVDAMLVDMDGDGLLDRLFNTSAETSDGECRASWRRNLGMIDGKLQFGSIKELTLPRLRWSGSSSDSSPPTGSPTAAGHDDPNFHEGCALNGQVTAYRNVIRNSSRFCHDGSQCTLSTTPGKETDYYCYTKDSFGLECPGRGVDGTYRTYLAYRWLDADGDGLTDLVTAVHGDIDAYDIVQGNDPDHEPDPEPFGPWPPCPPEQRGCRDVSRDCLESASTQAQVNQCIADAPFKPCDSLATTTYGMPGQPPSIGLQRFPYQRCEGLYPWFIYKNQGNGVLDTQATIVYSPVQLESSTGDSNLGGMTVSAQDHSIVDIDGDGYLDAVLAKSGGFGWQAWLGDGSGGFEPEMRFIRTRSPENRIFSVGYYSSAWTPDGTCQSSSGLFDLNGDGLDEHWLLSNDQTNLAWFDGANFVVYQFPNGRVGEVDTPAGVKPGNDVWFEVNAVWNSAIEGGISRARNRVVDVDNDGRADVVKADASPPLVHFNFGRQLLANPVEYPGDTHGLTREVHALTAAEDGDTPWEILTDLVDLDGDGIPESVSFENGLTRVTHPHGPPRLMRRIYNGRGAGTDVTYASMHDGDVVTQTPGVTWPDGRPKVSPQTRWVVRSLVVKDDFSQTAGHTSYHYANPRHGADDEGRYGFRGFESVTTTSTSGAQTLNRYSYDPDWSGRLVETIISESAAADSVRTISRTEWTARYLMIGMRQITTYHATSAEHLTCANGQSATTCTPASAAAYTRTTNVQTPMGPSGEPAMFWLATESLVQTGTTAADGDRRTLTDYEIKVDQDTYRIRPTTVTREHRENGSFVTFAKSAKTWIDTLLPLTSEVWTEADPAARAITRFEYDTTGNLVKRWKPEQNASSGPHASFSYDGRQLFVATEVNELGHQVDHQYEYGTGTKVQTEGPNTRTCATGPGCPLDATHPQRQQSMIRIDGLGRTLETWETVSTDSVSGVLYTLHQTARSSYVDTAVFPTTPASVTNEVRLTTTGTTWTKEKSELDGLGRPIKKTVFVQGTAPNDHITTYAYNSDGTMKSVTVPDPSQNNASVVTYTYAYDGLGRPTSIRRPDSTTLSARSGVDIAYDGVTQTTTEVVGAAGGNAATTKTVKDAFGRVIELHEQTNTPTQWAVTRYEYGPDDLVDRIVDAELVVVTLEHDWAGRRTAIDRQGRIWSYSYDRNGNLESEQVPGADPSNPLPFVTSIAYDDLDRPMEKLIGQRALSEPDQQLFGTGRETFEWDTGPNMIGQLRYWRSFARGATTPMITHDAQYDVQGRPIAVSQAMTIAGYPELERHVASTYHLFGGVAESYYGDEVGGTNATRSATHYDARGLPTHIVLSRGGEADRTLAVQIRNVAGMVTKRRTDISGPSGFVESNWTYDKLGRIEDQHVLQGASSTTVARQTLAYLGNDDPHTLTHQLGTNATQFTYQYDYRHQLRGASTNIPGYFDASYDYHPSGRFKQAIEQQTMSPAPAHTQVQSRGVDYVYAGADPEQVTALMDGTSTYASYAYDAAGNMTARCYGGAIATCPGELTTFVYDGKDQLRRVTKHVAGVVQGSEEYWYDGGGQRTAIVKRDSTGATTEMIRFLSSTQAHFDGIGSLQHVYSNITLGTPIARVDRTDDAATRLEHQFHGLSSATLAAVEDNGTINASFSYSPFGVVVEGTSAGGLANGIAAHPRQFNDKYSDSLSGLTYYGARYYDSVLVAWTQADPLYVRVPDLAKRGNPRRGNIYTFSLNNPVRFIDPDGLDPGFWSRTQHQRGFDAAMNKEAAGYATSGAVIDAPVGTSDPDEPAKPVVPPARRYVPDDLPSTRTYIPERDGHDPNKAKALAAGAIIGLGVVATAVIATELVAVVGATRTAAVVTGPYGTVSRAAVERAAASGAPWTTFLTKLTQAPTVGRALSTATGPGALALVNQARATGDVYTAHIPTRLVMILQDVGLLVMNQTQMRSAAAAEARFLPAAAEFIVSFFSKQQ